MCVHVYKMANINLVIFTKFANSNCQIQNLIKVFMYLYGPGLCGLVFKSAAMNPGEKREHHSYRYRLRMNLDDAIYEAWRIRI